MAGLDAVPFLGGFLQMDATNRAREGQQLQQAGQFQTLQSVMQQSAARQQAMQRDQAMRQAILGLKPDATPDQVAAVVRPYASADDLLKSSIASADRKSALDAKVLERETAREQRLHELEMRADDEIKKIRTAAEERRITQAQADEREARTRAEMIRLTASLRPPREEPAPIVQTGDDGTVKLFDRKGNLIKDLGKTGKPSAQFQKTEVQNKKLNTDLGRVIDELENASNDGGLIDQSTGSGAGALVDAAAGFIGKATPGAIAVGQLRPIYDMALKMVPRFEGPQSDKDTKSYEQASGQLANPAIPNDQKKAAAKEIVRLMKARREQFMTRDMVESGTEPKRTIPQLLKDADAIIGR